MVDVVEFSLYLAIAIAFIVLPWWLTRSKPLPHDTPAELAAKQANRRACLERYNARKKERESLASSQACTAKILETYAANFYVPQRRSPSLRWGPRRSPRASR
jgi:hypothetical protein